MTPKPSRRRLISRIKHRRVNDKGVLFGTNPPRSEQLRKFVITVEEENFPSGGDISPPQDVSTSIDVCCECNMSSAEDCDEGDSCKPEFDVTLEKEVESSYLGLGILTFKEWREKAKIKDIKSDGLVSGECMKDYATAKVPVEESGKYRIRWTNAQAVITSDPFTVG